MGIFLTLILAASGLGFLSVFLLARAQKSREELNFKNKELKRHLFEESLINELNDKIGYSLNIETVSEVILDATSRLIPFSAISYALIKTDGLYITTRKKENTGEKFSREIERIVCNAFSAIEPTINASSIKSHVMRFDAMIDNNTYFDAVPVSYFNIPLVVNNKLVGMIHIASKEKGQYQEADMSLLFKIVNRASQAVGKLENLIETEKGKTDSLIYSLSSGAILFKFDASGVRIEIINSAAKEFLRLKEDAAVQEVILSFGQTFAIVEKIKEVVRDKKSLIIKNVDIYDRHFKLTISPVFFYDSERIIGVSVTMQDVTLEHEIESLRANFTNMVVHELRSPLSAINAAVGILKGKVLASDKEKMLGVIENSTEQMLSEVGELLDAAKIDSGKFEISKKSMDIQKVVKERAEAFMGLASEKRISLSTSFEVGIPIFEFDPVRICQVIDNLLSNSIKFTQSGGEVSIKIRVKNGFLETVVSDNGVGISDQEKSKIFGKFSQFGHKRGIVGTGLGLYIAKGIVEAHGGSIAIDSKQGKGTNVTFSLPLGFEKKYEVRLSPQYQEQMAN